MEVRTLEECNGPLPAADGAGSAWWAAAARGSLLVQHCPSCGSRQLYPRAICITCGADPEWEEASGRGIVHTFTVIRQNGVQPFRDMLPYVVAVVELEEGPRLMGNIAGCPVDAVFIGMPVVAYSVKVSEDVGFISWEAVGSEV